MNIGNKLNPVSEDSVLAESYIIIRINDISNKLFLINAEGKPRKPICFAYDEIKKEIANKLIHIASVSYSYYSLQDDADIKDDWKAVRDKRWEIIKPLVSEQKDLDMFLEYEKSSPVIGNRSREAGVSRPSIYKFIYMYLQGGLRRNALLPDYHKVGHGHHAIKKVGPPRKDKATGFVMTDECKELIKKSLKDYYYSKDEPGIKDTYDYLCDNYYSDEVFDEKEEIYVKVHWGDNRKPSIHQFRRWAKAFIDPVAASKKRLGRSKHDKDKRPLNSSSDLFVRGPGELYEIDATVGDIYLVSEFDRSRKTLIGRPVIYMVTDVYSRAIVGMYVGLEGPSWDGARAALYNTFSDKVEYCKGFDLQIAHEEWPMNCLCTGLLADRGEIISKQAEVILDSIGVKHLAFTSPYRGDLKGLVEKHFDIINDLVIQYLPGSTVKIKRERGARKPELDGMLTLKELTKLIALEVVEHNSSKVKNVVGDIERARDKVIETPSNLWDWGMKYGMGAANTIEADALYLGLLPKDDAKVRGDGIYYKGLRYHSESGFIQQQMSLSRMRKKRLPIQIKYTRSTTNYIWFIHPEDKSINICYLNDTMEKYRNLDHDELLDQQERESATLKTANKKREKGLARTRAVRMAMIDAAKKEKKGKGRNKTDDIKASRAKEKLHERRADAKKAEKASGIDSDKSAPTEKPERKKKSQENDTVDLINQLLGEDDE
ncbi:DDE-type integrase/transposase/recombinase [Endozoicomonas ascidiicola]|uniref:DDE-type integrase/transposase/recombinase n=1 Tax=Endozoicomonas ascidiicola TaxID=1698521 RepID=UPI0008308067|nr:DDE-type integrase/transposase/recombinase [Endozoicomonas ascidiicola]